LFGILAGDLSHFARGAGGAGVVAQPRTPVCGQTAERNEVAFEDNRPIIGAGLKGSGG
jgi:hypothetical protein